MGIDTHVYYFSKKYFEVEPETSTFVKRGKTITAPFRFHVILKHPIPFAEFDEIYNNFYYEFEDDKDYDDDEMVHDFWIYSSTYIEECGRNPNETTLILPSIKMEKGSFIKYELMSFDGYGRKYFHHIEKNIDDFEPDADYYYITTYD